MPLVRTAGTPEPDTNPVFWRCWEQLGHAVVLQACRDYASARKKLEKRAATWSEQATGSDRYNPMVDIARYEKFFRSKYFAYICPKFDGHMMFDKLKGGGWRNIPKGHHHYTPKTVYALDSDYYQRQKLLKQHGGQHGRGLEQKTAQENESLWHRAGCAESGN